MTGFTTGDSGPEGVREREGWVGLWHDGVFIARFEVTWQASASNGHPGPTRMWGSGNQTAGFTHKCFLAGEASNIRIRAEALTSLLGPGWDVVMDTDEFDPPNRWYRLFGTILNPDWDNRSYNLGNVMNH